MNLVIIIRWLRASNGLLNHLMVDGKFLWNEIQEMGGPHVETHTHRKSGIQ